MGRPLSAAALLIIGLAAVSPSFGQRKLTQATAAKSPFDMEIVPWSLEPALGATEARLGMRAEAPRKSEAAAKGVETITVFGKRRAPTEEALHQDAPEAEAWQSDAAQPMVPGMGDRCSYKSGCFDKGQKGLFSTVPGLFGGN